MKASLKISVLSAHLFSSLAFYSVPPGCEAAVTPARIVRLAALSMSRNCAAGVMDQLCSSVTNFLNDESAKADADAKACRINCNWKKRKDELVDGARKKAKESCAKGEAPDAQELSKGLDRNAKAKLKSLYDNNSRMFDGSAKLAAKDLEPVPSNSAALTGKGGQVTDLKTSEPDTPKLNSPTEFSLSGTKLSGETPGQAATKQSPILLASAASEKSLYATSAAAKAAVSATSKATINSSDGTTVKVQESSSSQCADWEEELADLRDTIGYMKVQLQMDCSRLDPYDQAFCYAAQERIKRDLPKKEARVEELIQLIAQGCGSNPCSAGQVPTPSGCDCPPKCPSEQVCTLAKKCEFEYGMRSLTAQEKKLLQGVFENSINYNIVTIEHRKGQGQLLTSGSKIIIYDTYMDDQGAVETYFKDNAWTENGKSRLIHEATHVWQNQHTNPLIRGAQKLIFHAEKWIGVIKALLDGDPDTDPNPIIVESKMYSWHEVAKQTPLEKFTLGKLNYEQEAELVREYYKKTYFEKKYKEYMEKIIEEIRAKKAT